MLGVIGVCFAFALVAAACGQQQQRFSLNFQEAGSGQAIAPMDLGPYNQFVDVQVRTKSVTGPAPVITTGTLNGSSAARFPAPQTTGNDARGVIVVRNLGDDDPNGGGSGNGLHDYLDPGPYPFEWGADIRLDQGSLTGGKDMPNGDRIRDNGNNIIQRGRAAAGAQYKLEVDGVNGVTFAKCVVQGPTGQAIAISAQPVAADTDYRITCERPAGNMNSVTVTVTTPGGAFVTSGSGTGQAYGNANPPIPATIGDLDFPIEIPMFIGGKIDIGAPAADPIADDVDQFNGLIDNVYLEIFSP